MAFGRSRHTTANTSESVKVAGVERHWLEVGGILDASAEEAGTEVYAILITFECITTQVFVNDDTVRRWIVRIFLDT